MIGTYVRWLINIRIYFLFRIDLRLHKRIRNKTYDQKTHFILFHLFVACIAIWRFHVYTFFLLFFELKNLDDFKLNMLLHFYLQPMKMVTLFHHCTIYHCMLMNRKLSITWLLKYHDGPMQRWRFVCISLSLMNMYFVSSELIGFKTLLRASLKLWIIVINCS